MLFEFNEIKIKWEYNRNRIIIRLWSKGNKLFSRKKKIRGFKILDYKEELIWV